MVSLAFITVYWVVSKELGGGKYIQPSKQNFFISNRCQTSPFLTILVLFRLIRAFIVFVYPGYQLTYGFPRIHYSFSGTKRQKSTQNIVTQLNRAQHYEQFDLLLTLLNKTRESMTHRNCVIKIILLAPMCDAAYYRHQIQVATKLIMSETKSGVKGEHSKSVFWIEHSLMIQII